MDTIKLVKWSLATWWARWNVFGHYKLLKRFYSIAESRGLWSNQHCLTLQRNGIKTDQGTLSGFMCAGTKPEDRWIPGSKKLCNFCETDYDIRRALGFQVGWRWKNYFKKLWSK